MKDISNLQEFTKEINKDQLTIVDFHAVWCGKKFIFTIRSL